MPRARRLALFAIAVAGALANAVSFADTAPGSVVEPIEKVAPLVLAARDNDAQAAVALLAAHPAPDVNQRTADGTSALQWAVHHGAGVPYIRQVRTHPRPTSSGEPSPAKAELCFAS